MFHIVPSKPNWNYSLPGTWNLVCHRLIVCQHHTFQHCPDMFKLKKHVKCSNLAKTINQHGYTMELNSSLPMYTTAYKLIALSLAFLAITSFHKLLRHEIDIAASYHTVSYLQHCYAWVVTSSAVHDYWKCYINAVTRMCLGFY